MDETSNPLKPAALSRPDVLHEQQLLRDLAVVNARTHAELGPLPPSGLLVAPKPKPKPKPWQPMAPQVTAQSNMEDEAMKLSHAAAVAALGVAGTLAAACQPSAQTGMNSGKERKTAMDTSRGTNPINARPGTSDAAHHRELLERIGGTCKYPGKWDGCMAGDYDLELMPGCDADGFFAGVSNEQGALLLDKAPPDDNVKLATLSKGQIVCIEAIARAGQDPAYYYVTAVPETSIEACADNPLCTQYGDRQIQWHSDAARQACTASGAGRLHGDCASGWVDAVDLDVFSNGM